ncbi:MAG: hypothetical protein BGO51_17435 [Rhodospirillales bacterium 69-11]|nr:MAG: hypothetical protein BGO51_17435 [Rhodospirillales bacterium 69-11]
MRAGRGVGLLLAASGALALAGAAPARADTAAAKACATSLPKEARTIFDATLPQVTPGVNLRELVTSNTRRLVGAGSVELGSARTSAEEAGKCLRMAE